jgi:hypothetical protein
MVIDNLDQQRTPVIPLETNPVLIVDSNAMLSFPITGKFFKAITRWHHQIVQPCRRIQLIQLPCRDSPEVTRA